MTSKLNLSCVLVTTTAALTSAWVSSNTLATRASIATAAASQLPRHQASTLSHRHHAISLTARHVSATPELEEVSAASPFPELGDDGIYHITSREEHEAFVQANRDKLIVLKVFAPWCRACKGLAPKFLAVRKDDKYSNLPIVWADLSIQHNKGFVKSLGVLALPTVQFYVGGAIADTFPCGPSKVPILKRKLAQLVNTHVDPSTFLVKESSLQQEALTPSPTAVPANNTEAAVEKIKQEIEATSPADVLAPPKSPAASLPKNDTAEATPVWTSPAPLISEDERRKFRETIPHLGSMSLADFDQVMDSARLLTFEAGSIIMREGKPGSMFYIIKDGEVEISQKTFCEDPLQYPSYGSYLGTVVNRLEKHDFFGERSLLTGEPRAASIRAVETTSCYAFDQAAFPASSPLSGRTKLDVSDYLEVVDEKYGVNLSGLYAQEVLQQIQDANAASQVRGSIHKPNKIVGVDTEDDIEFDEIEDEADTQVKAAGLAQQGNDVFSVLRRFKMIRQVSKCLNYIQLTNAKWGNAGIRNRRSMLVGRLSPAQREEYAETFDLIDLDKSGQISLAELKKVMSSVNDDKTDEELFDIMATSVDMERERPGLNKQDFMGLMAEAEFYNLFRDIFKSLDPDDSGYVKAGELDRVLGGIRDLISNDHKSIIDVDTTEERDMLIDYEQFSRMLLGSSA